MPIELAPDLEAIVREKVKAGEYDSPDALLRDAVARLDVDAIIDAWPVEELRAAIAVGIDQLERGESRDGEEVMAELRARFALPPETTVE